MNARLPLTSWGFVIGVAGGPTKLAAGRVAAHCVSRRILLGPMICAANGELCLNSFGCSTALPQKVARTYEKMYAAGLT